MYAVSLVFTICNQFLLQISGSLPGCQGLAVCGGGLLGPWTPAAIGWFCREGSKCIFVCVVVVLVVRPELKFLGP